MNTTKTVNDYSFEQPTIANSKLPVLEHMHDRLAKVMRASISELIGHQIDFSAEALEFMKYHEYVKAITPNASINIWEFGNLPGQNLLILDAHFVTQVINYLFGGNKYILTNTPDRDYTTVEYRVIKTITDMFITCYTEILKDIYATPIVYKDFTNNIQYITIAEPSDNIIISTFTMEYNNVLSRLQICIPYANIKPIQEKLAKSYINPTRVQSKGINTEKIDVELLVKTNIGECTLKEVSNLTSGDFFMLTLDGYLEVNDSKIIDTKYELKSYNTRHQIV